MSTFVDMLFIVSGAYLIYSALIAKKNKTINKDIMLGKKMNENVIEDKLGYIEYMYKRIIVAGAMITASGLLNLVNDIYLNSGVAAIMASVILLAAVIMYVRVYKKGQQLYMRTHKNRKI